LESADLTGTLRLLARPGDVLLLVGDAGSETAGDILRRAEAWGLLRITMGAGRPPAPGLAEHSVVLEGADPDIAARSGDVVMLYHLLWELTHVVFEHPGLLESEQDCSGPTCVTCADLAEVAEVRSMRAGGAGGTTAEVVVAGLVETVEVGLVENCRPGDLVLVQAGVALSRLSDLPSATGDPPRAEGVPE
ncbi:MAG: HypC/HybG/HupF family hydrogenase formation chaperone, partial [Acidimicrobiales bacterium]